MKKKVYLRKEPAAYSNVCYNKDKVYCYFWQGIDIVCTNPYYSKYPCINPNIVYIKVKEIEK